MQRTLAVVMVVVLAFAAQSFAAPPKIQVKAHTLGAAQLVAGLFTGFEGLMNWGTQAASGFDPALGFVIATNQGSGVVTYSEGVMYYNKATSTWSTGNGQVNQFFSDRLWLFPSTEPGFLNIPTNPFDPAKTDKLGVALALTKTSGVLTLTLKSKGNAKVVVPLQTQHNMYYGFGTATPYVLHSIAFKKMKVPWLY